jgi:hypothetical protein
VEFANEIDRILTLMSSQGLVVVRDWRGACRLAVWDGLALRVADGAQSTSRTLRFLDLPKPPSSSALHTMLEAGLIEMAPEYASSGASVHTLTKEGRRVAQWRSGIRMGAESAAPGNAERGPGLMQREDNSVAGCREAIAARHTQLAAEGEDRIQAARVRLRKQARLVRRLRRIPADTNLAESLLKEMANACRLLEARQRASVAAAGTIQRCRINSHRLLGQRR